MLKTNYKAVGLDIGSAKTTLCIGSLDNLGRIEIHNAAMVKTRGIERGVITNLGELASSVEEVVKKAEQKFNSRQKTKSAKKKNIKIHSVFATISGEHVLGNNTKGMLNLSNRPVEISRRDRQRAIDSAKFLSSSSGREILHAIDQEFMVDGYKRIKDPLGIYGTRLGVNLHIISAEASFVSNIVKAVNRAGLDVEGVAYSGFVTSLSMLTDQEKQAGVILLEFGAGTVNILFFSEGSLQYTSVIPMGGNDITRAIARHLNIDMPQAEELKMQYRNVSTEQRDNKEYQEEKILVRKDSTSYESITRKQLADIVDAKLNELFKLVKKELSLAGILSQHNCGIVICGGMSFMDGMIEKLEKLVKLKVKMGIARGFLSGFSGSSNIFYATGIGLVMHALKERDSFGKATFSSGDILAKILAKARNIYEEYF